ncbi:hypothetical protein RHMOL_Rhmol12G0042500 [Rhododendron molle]|uniref:Uncharacterized protein n=1 Tax=Rhododendron molle TaxID=49168 RepID=A0ACC0LEF2_RHOML|nr:hypothetical protein RHMOL_Rhmol12G0042500 [Rhododendron molle]
MNSSDSQSINGDSTNASTADFNYGFRRQEMYKTPLVGTVDAYDRHVFLCYRNPENWPHGVEDPESDPLPRLLAAALKSNKNSIHGKIRLTMCEGSDGRESSNGDILIFPDMIKYRGLTHLDVDAFVDDVFVKGSQWASGTVEIEMLNGSYVFVCCHKNRDRRCGHCGPVLVERFKEEMLFRAAKHQVFVSPCSHLGGHQYAGNLIIFGPRLEGKCEGHWYGYVTSNDVPVLLDEHIEKGKIMERLWRGQMGSDVSKKLVEPKLQETSAGISDKGSSGSKAGAVCCSDADGVCCLERNEAIGETNLREGTGTKRLGRL